MRLLQFGQYTVPLECISTIDTNFRTGQGATPGVRVYLRPSAVPGTPFWDFTGPDATAIRQNLAILGGTEEIVVLLAAPTAQRETASHGV